MSYIPLHSRRAVRISAPATEPVSLDEAKQFLHIDHSEDDTLISNLIAAAREAAEQFTRRSFISQTWQLSYDDNVPFHVDMPYGPVQSITSVTAEAADASQVTVNPQAYRLLANDVLRVEGYVHSHKVHIAYVAGYGEAAANVPAPIRQGIMQHVALMLESRETTVDIPGSSISLYAAYKKIGV